MKILKMWNVRRLLFLAAGVFFTAIAVKDGVWWMAIFGLYFTAMSLFRFGCASANCGVNQGRTGKNQDFHQLN